MKKNVIIIMSLLVMLVITSLVIIGSSYYTTVTSPVNVYKKIATESIGEIIKTTTKTTSTKPINIFANIDAQTNILDENSNQLNDLKLILNLQADAKNKDYVLKGNSFYMGQKLLNANIHYNAKTNKFYLYAMEILDKYLELDSKDVLKEDMQKALSKTPLVITDGETLSKILAKEVESFITESMCKREQDTYVLKVAYSDLVMKLTGTISRLSLNQEFLNCFEDKQLVKDRLEEIKDKLLELASISGELEVNINMKASKTLYLKHTHDTEIKEIVIGNIMDSTKTFTYKENDVIKLSGNVGFTVSGDNTIWNINLVFSDGKKIYLTATTNITQIDSVMPVNYSKVSRITDLTKSELIQMALKIENPIIVKWILPLVGNNLPF